MGYQFVVDTRRQVRDSVDDVVPSWWFGPQRSMWCANHEGDGSLVWVEGP